MAEAKKSNNKRTIIIAAVTLVLVIVAILLIILLTRAKPAAFEVSGLLITPAEVQIEQPVTVQATVSNTGGSQGTYNAELKVNGVVKDSRSLTVNARENQPAVFLLTEDNPGTYQIELGGLNGQFTVVEAPAADFRSSGLVIDPARAASGEQVSITFSLSNAGNADGSFPAVLIINGTTEETRPVSLAPGGEQQVQFVLTDKEPGEYTVEIAGLTGEFTVIPPPTAAPTTAATELRTWIITDDDVERLFAQISDKSLNAHFVPDNIAEFVLAGFPGWINVGVKNGKLCEYPVDPSIYALFPEIHDYIFFEDGVEYLAFTWFDPTIEIAADVTSIPVMVSVTTEKGRAIVIYEWPPRE